MAQNIYFKKPVFKARRPHLLPITPLCSQQHSGVIIDSAAWPIYAAVQPVILQHGQMTLRRGQLHCSVANDSVAWPITLWCGQ
jgi:hypothetical protein